MRIRTAPSTLAASLAVCTLIAACGGGGPGSQGATASNASGGGAAAGGQGSGAGGQGGGAGGQGGGAAASLPAPLKRRTKATLILDFIPNAVHAGIYRALAEGLYRHENIALQVVQPSETKSTLNLIDAGSADFGLADGSDLATLIAKGGDAQAVMAIAQRPLGGLISRASEHLSSPAQLQGRAVGVTGVPSDTAVLDTEVSAAGGDPSKVKVVNVGFDGAQALRAGRIAAFTGFWPADGVQLQVTGEPVRSFKLDHWGGPPYPGLVAFTTRKLIASSPALIRDFVAATVEGYEQTLQSPKQSLNDLISINPEVQRKVASASLQAYLPLFDEGGKVPFGTLQASHIEALSRWMTSHGLIGSAISPQRYGTSRFLPGAAASAGTGSSTAAGSGG